MKSKKKFVFQLIVWNKFFSFVARGLRRLKKIFRGIQRKTIAHLWTTYTPKEKCVGHRLAQRFSFMDDNYIEELINDFPDYPELILEQSEQTLKHCFDLLGSGPVVVKKGMQCDGVDGIHYATPTTASNEGDSELVNSKINFSNRKESSFISSLIDKNYTPIDWHLDFKSGYRWEENCWHEDIRYGHLLGVDVKVPWELSRLQHLPNIGMAAHFARKGLTGFRNTFVYGSEFKNQILDFISNNPPGFGVNWACPMDIAIRLSNMLLAKDLLASSGVVFSEDFESIFMASAIAHANHISANLEWAPLIRGNHYLANIAGLLFASVYLPCTSKVNTWLKFAVEELINEVHYQFHEDGSNFEGSVCYHRLSAEIIVWSVSLISNLDKEKKDILKQKKRCKWNFFPTLEKKTIKFYSLPNEMGDSPLPPSVWKRLEKMGKFSETMTKPDGTVVQFGDNDSGRFINFGSGEQMRAKNNPASPLWSLDHKSLIAGISVLCNLDKVAVNKNLDVASKVLKSLVTSRQKKKLNLKEKFDYYHPTCLINSEKEFQNLLERFRKTPSSAKWVTIYKADFAGLFKGMEIIAFSGMGCYVVRGPRIYLAVRCGEIGLQGLGAHTHCDQLAIELVIDGKTIVKDPGTMYYTPFPEKRNLYRSALAHHVPRILNKEPASLFKGIFDLSDAQKGECLYFGCYGFAGRHYGYGSWVYRIISFEDDRLIVNDFSEKGLKISNPSPIALNFSQSYGRNIQIELQ